MRARVVAVDFGGELMSKWHFSNWLLVSGQSIAAVMHYCCCPNFLVFACNATFASRRKLLNGPERKTSNCSQFISDPLHGKTQKGETEMHVWTQIHLGQKSSCVAKYSGLSWSPITLIYFAIQWDVIWKDSLSFIPALLLHL